MNKDDLVSLVYGENTDFVELKNIYALEKEGVKINIEKKTWSDNENDAVPFGKSLNCSSFPKYVIGVYDRGDITHLKEMMKIYRTIPARLK